MHCHIMTIWIKAVVVVWSLVGSAVCAFCQELEDFPDSALTREQWQQRVEDSRHRAEEFVANARSQAAISPPSEQEETEAARQRALNDPSLRHGDIIATGQGFVVFVGREEQHQPNNFVPAPDPRYGPK
jgi:hypothetical protein